MNLKIKSLLLVGVLATSLSAMASDQMASVSAALTSSNAVQSPTAGTPQLVFDNMTSVLDGVPGAVASSTTSTPNTFMGAAYTLAAGTTSITGFDFYPVNSSQTATTFTALKINVYIWGGVNMGTVSAAAPAFSNLLGSVSFTSSGNSYDPGFFYTFEGAELTTPISLTGTTIGLTFNIQGSTDGVTFSNVNNLTSLITYGVAPTVGSAVFNGYFRNGNNEVNGNFTSGVRSLGQTNQSLGVRIYGDVTAPVPEPSVYLMMGLGLAVMAIARRRKTQA